ncbi:MAG: hypothetical protein RMJ14_06115 [Nitrososphaerota archaeon]|nr:hypothetical protein [Aigarchaeota archaeon]MDW8077187.1 hypothetical protein [Nitrososphaerota archaeon]
MSRRVHVLLITTALVLTIVLAQLSTFTVTVAASPREAEKAEALIEVAKKASIRIEYLLNEVKSNVTIIDLAEAEELYKEGNILLSQAEVAIQERNYDDAVRLAISAMQRFREVRMILAPVIEQAEAEDGLLRAQGLLIAANRTLERIARLEESLPELQETLDVAKSLLNLDEITKLLQEGKVSEAARRIAEANRLICQALKSIAEKAVPNRMERFTERLRERYEGLIGKLQNMGENLRELLNETGFKNLNEFRDNIQSLKEAIRSIGPENAKGLMGQLMSFVNGLKKLERKVLAIPTTPSEPGSVSALIVEIVEKRVTGNLKRVFLDIRIKNAGDTRLQFQNSAYGLTIERKGEDGIWKPYYSPISAQTIVFLEAGQSTYITVKLNQPQPGEYRVRVRGICEQSGQPIEAITEFSIP